MSEGWEHLITAPSEGQLIHTGSGASSVLGVKRCPKHRGSPPEGDRCRSREGGGGLRGEGGRGVGVHLPSYGHCGRHGGLGLEGGGCVKWAGAARQQLNSAEVKVLLGCALH